MKSKGKTTDALQMQIYLGRNLFRFLQNSGDKKSSLSIVNRNAQFAAGTDSITIADLALLATYSTMKVGRVGSGVVEILI